MVQDDNVTGSADSPGPEEPQVTAESPSAGAGDAWHEVVVQIDALGSAVSAWTRSAIEDPENRRHAAEIRAKLESITHRVASTIDEASKTEVGSAVVDGAEKTGQAVVDAGGKVVEAAAPHVASALTGLAGILGSAAERVGKATAKPAQPAEEEAAVDAEADDESAPDAGQH